MKVFKFHSDDLYYAYSGRDEQEAKETLENELGDIEIDEVEEIPESKWDEKIITSWEDNDTENEPFMLSIRDVMSENHPQMIFTNDMSFF